MQRCYFLTFSSIPNLPFENDITSKSQNYKSLRILVYWFCLSYYIHKLCYYKTTNMGFVISKLNVDLEQTKKRNEMIFY